MSDASLPADFYDEDEDGNCDEPSIEERLIEMTTNAEREREAIENGWEIEPEDEDENGPEDD